MPISRASALRRIRLAVDPAMDFNVSSVVKVHESNPVRLYATVIVCENSRKPTRPGGHARAAKGDACYPVKVLVKTNYDIELGGRKGGMRKRRSK